MAALLGGHRFSGPFALGRRGLPGVGGVYAISCGTAYPDVHYLLYVGETGDFSKRGIDSGHRKYWCWNGAGSYVQKNPGAIADRTGTMFITGTADTIPLYVSMLRVDSESQRWAIETCLIDRLRPPCNGKLTRAINAGCYEASASWHGSHRLRLFRIVQ